VVFLFAGIRAAAQTSGLSGGEAAQAIDGTSGGTGEETDGEVSRREAERGYLLYEGGAVPQTTGGASSAWALFRGVIVLAVAAAAIYGVVYFLKRKKADDLPDDAYLKVLARAPINVKTAAAVIAVGGKAWLVGLSDAGVSLISEITDQETVDAMILSYSGQAAPSRGPASFSFTDILRRFTGGGSARKTEDAADIPQPPNLRRNRERLRNL
jgi:flagellar protein FliO/FliZ